MIKFLTGLIVALLVSINVFSQPAKGSFHVTGKVKVDQGVVDGTHLELFKNGVRIQDLVINRTGNFRVIIELNQTYRFHFVNTDYYPKTIEFDTHLPPGVCNTDCSFPPYELALQLYKKVAGVSPEQQAPPRISYNPKLDIFDPEMLREQFDLKKMINEALSDAKEKAALYDQKKIADKKATYDRLINQADTYFRQGALETSMNSYRDAAMILPGEKYPRDKVDQIYKLLMLPQLQKNFGNPNSDNYLKYLNYGDLKFAEREYTIAQIAYECALNVKPDEQSIKNKHYQSVQEVKKIKDLGWEEINHRKLTYASRTSRYNELISAGDTELRKENILAAKDLYAQAVTQIEENSYSLLMLKKLDEIISNEELAIKLNRERDEAEKKRLMNARNQAYTDAVTEADRLLSERLYLDAIEYYELALTIKEYELYPRKQIESIKDIMAKLRLVGEEYNKLIRQGDNTMQQKEYALAKEAFTQAHALIPEEKYALDKLAEIELLIKRQSNQKNIDAEYNTAIAQADGLFIQKKYPEAITGYEKASKIKPEEKYPRDQITKIRGILSRETEGQKNLLQKQAEYDQIITQADDQFNRRSYQAARSLYQRALQVIPGQEYPLSQIRKIDELSAQITSTPTSDKSHLDQIDFSNLQNLSKEDREAAYKEAMEMGESFFKTKEWGVARFYFRRALSLIPNDNEATKRVNETEKMLRSGDVNESKFAEFIKKADESFITGDISVAKFYYAKALELKPADTYAKERLSITDQLLRSSISSASERDFDDAISKGNEAFGAKNYSLARFFYRKALSLKPGNTVASAKLEQSEKALQGDKKAAGDSEFEKNIQLGNQEFKNKNYGVARNYYKQALALNPNDSYAKDQLTKIETLLKNQQ